MSGWRIKPGAMFNVKEERTPFDGFGYGRTVGFTHGNNMSLSVNCGSGEDIVTTSQHLQPVKKPTVITFFH